MVSFTARGLFWEASGVGFKVLSVFTTVFDLSKFFFDLLERGDSTS